MVILLIELPDNVILCLYIVIQILNNYRERRFWPYRPALTSCSYWNRVPLVSRNKSVALTSWFPRIATHSMTTKAFLYFLNRNKAGIWGWRTDKTEMVNGFESKVSIQ